MKTRLTILAIAIVAIMAISSMSIPVRAATTYGPRIDELLCKIYGTDVAEFAALEASDIDLLDWPAGRAEVTRWSAPPYSDTIVLDPYREIGLYEFDINNNETLISYPNWPSPTHYPEVRHAIAHLTDKPFIISTYVGGYGAQCESPIMPWLAWYDPTMAVHLYDPEMAKLILFNAGWKPDTTDASDAKFPAGHPMAGQLLKNVMTTGPHGASDPGLILYRRSDSLARSLAGGLLCDGDATHKGLQDIGVPVDDNNVPRGTTSPKVMYQKDFHIYTGGWSLSRDPDYLYDLYHPDMYNPSITEFAQNYNNVDDPLWNGYVKEGLKYATSISDALIASHLACQRFGEVVFFVPIWTTLGYSAHKKPWHALNVDSFGVRNWWNLESIHNPEIGSVGGQLKWGFKSDVELLNVYFSQWVWDWQVLDKLFDSMIAMNPLNIAVDMPWMASGWTIGTWTNPDTGKTASKISFTLRTDMKWITPITGAVNSAVTPADVKFSFQDVYDHIGWNYASVADLYVNPDGTQKVEISGNTITFYETIASVWAFHWLGGLPIVPKAVFEPIADPHGFYPGGVYPATLMGSGNFYFSSYAAGVSVLLTANRNYFKPIVPDIDTNPTTIKIEWGIFKSNPKSGDWTVNVLDLITVAGSLGWLGPPGDIPQDINKDGKVNVLDLIIVATNIGASW